MYLEAKIKEIERMALTKVNEVIQTRGRVLGLQMNEDDKLIDGEREANDWKSKYCTLQKNNKLLQKSFRDQKTKLKQTEQILRSYQKQSSKVGVSFKLI